MPQIQGVALKLKSKLKSKLKLKLKLKKIENGSLRLTVILTSSFANRFPSLHDLSAFFYAPNPRGGFEIENEIETEIEVEVEVEVEIKL